MIGEKRFRATSLESLIDDVVSLINGPRYETVTYKIASPVKKFPNRNKLAICHPEPSPQAIYNCHTSVAYKGYIVPLVGKNGSMTATAVAVCHHDRVIFNHFLLEVLEAFEDEMICHFLPEDHFIWIRSWIDPSTCFLWIS